MYQYNPLLLEGTPSYIKKLAKGVHRVKDVDGNRALAIENMLKNHVTKGKHFAERGLVKSPAKTKLGPKQDVYTASGVFRKGRPKGKPIDARINSNEIQHRINNRWRKSA